MMATTLDLTRVNEHHAYIKKIQQALAQAVGQKIPIINIGKVKRVTGVSGITAEFVFEGGQALSLFIRASADATKARLNGKTIVLPGDFSNDWQHTFDAGVNGVAKLIRDGQTSFEAKRNKQKVQIPKSAESASRSNSISSRLKAVQEQETNIDQTIAEKNAIVDQLQDQLEQLEMRG